MLYISESGDYGDSEGLVIVDNDSFDEHFYGYLDNCSDWLRGSYAEWFEKNDHDFLEGESGIQWECQTCEDWIEDFKSIQS
jgi:hypothetical protein